MKYLKLYEKFIHNDEIRTEELFSPLIDWDMIENIKDMALEYLDYGKTLYINAHYKTDESSNRSYDVFKNYVSGGFYILMIEFTHHEYKTKWSNISTLVNKINVIDYLKPLATSDNIYYSFYLSKYPHGPYVRDTKELAKRIKVAYPNKNIIYEY